MKKIYRQTSKKYKNIDFNVLDEEKEETREEFDGDVFNNIADLIEVQDDDEE